MPLGSYALGSSSLGGAASPAASVADGRLRIYVDGRDVRGDFLVPRSMRIDRRLNGRSTLRFQMYTVGEQYRPEIGDPVRVRKGLATIFAGTVDSLDVDDMDYKAERVSVSCVDYNQTLDRRIVARAFDPNVRRVETSQADFTLGDHDGTTPTSDGLAMETNGAVRLDGTNDHVSIAGHADFSFGTGDFAIEIAEQPWLLAGDFRMLYCNQTTDNCQFIISDTGRLQFYGGALIAQSDVLSWTLGRWYHLAVTRISGTIHLYRDGVLVASAASSASIGNTTAINLGYRNATGSHPFNGRIDELRVWKGVGRTQEQIQGTMGGEIAADTAGLKCYLKFNEASGSTAQDSTANDHDGTLVNGAAFQQLYRTWSNTVAQGTRTSPQLGLAVVGDVVTSALNYSVTHAMRCLEFDGTDDGLDFGAAQAGQPGNDFTVQIANAADATQGAAYTLAATKWGSNLGWKVRGAAGVLKFHYGNGTTTKELTFTGIDIRDDTWRMLTVVKSSTAGVLLYVDGALVNSNGTMTEAVAHFPAGKLVAGLAFDDGVGYSEPFKGKLQEFRMWNRALDGAEVAANHDQPLEGSEVNLLGYWRMSDGDGTVVRDDASGPTTIVTNGAFVDSPSWTEDGLVPQTRVVVQTSTDGGATWQDAASGEEIPGIDAGEDVRDQTLDVRQVLTSYMELGGPVVDEVEVDVSGSQTLRDIVLSIVETELAGEGISADEVQDGPQISRAVFNYVPISRAFEELSKITGLYWMVDFNKVLHFKETGTDQAPFDFGPANRHYRADGRTEDRSRYRNKQYVRGGLDITASQTEAFSGNSKLQTFPTRYPIAEAPKVRLNGAPQTVGIRGVDTGADWYWQKNTATVTQDEDGTPISSSDELLVTYRGYVPILMSLQDDASIAERQDKEGGTGIYESVDTDQSIESQNLAFEKAAGLLRKYDRMIENVQLETDRDGLAPGQQIGIEDADIDADGDWLIESVGISDVSPGLDDARTGERLRYRVRAIKGEVVGSDLAFFRQLAEGGKDLVIRENEVVPQLASQQDDVLVTDSASAVESASDCAVVAPGMVTGDAEGVVNFSEVCGG